ncbi:TAXI family TRAP transporter solute-binding subunit [Aeromonas molluscorum]|jgi:uncharacterized protein|uniref:TAXI family TRAP transporter solute-binding subunit n=1 Tax=Aeromonas molluscorum TaxID=271417 RepID=UPI003F1E031B
MKLLPLLPLLMIPSLQAAPTLYIGTGSEQGIYYQMAKEFCRLAHDQDDSTSCRPLATSGSLENLKRLKEDASDYAIVQSDWLYQANKGIGAFEGAPQPRLRSLFATHAEPFTLVVRADGDITSLEQLKLAPIDLGLKGSGTRKTALALMAQLGVKEQDLDLKSMANLPQALCSKQIDAFALVMGHPNRMVLDASKQCRITFLPIDGEVRDKLIKGRPYYQRSQIPARIYPANPKPIPTFAIAATLVSRVDVPEEQVYRLTKAMLSQQIQFNEQTYGYANLFHRARNKIGPVLMVPQHPGAARYFAELKAAGKL